MPNILMYIECFDISVCSVILLSITRRFPLNTKISETQTADIAQPIFVGLNLHYDYCKTL